MKMRIKELRKQRGLTQREVADMAGMSTSYFTELEKGTKQINANRMASIARALGVKPQDLIDDEIRAESAELSELLDALSDDDRELVRKMAIQLAKAKLRSA